MAAENKNDDEIQALLEADLDDPQVRAFWGLLNEELEYPYEDIEPGLRERLMDGLE